MLFTDSIRLTPASSKAMTRMVISAREMEISSRMVLQLGSCKCDRSDGG